MPTISTTIRILEKEPNKKGDLFGRLMGDYFLVLGYDNARFNIHKSGREIDLEAEHRTEQRRVIAECKAKEEPTGGDEINKFVGSLDAEKRKSEVDTTGYFISLSGFKETAIEQENEVGGKRLILVNGEQVVTELVKGHIIVSPEQAMERAGRCAVNQSDCLLPEKAYELLAHELGWIWVIYYSQNKERTHFTLIHADGETIALSIAKTIIESDLSVGGSLNSLTYLPPQDESPIYEKQIFEAKKKYFNYLANECGEIQLEGLPADQEIGARRLNLENIFVPLHLIPSSEHEQNVSLITEDEDHDHKYEQTKRESVGNILRRFSHLTILAAPGSGKSTLLKRLAIAYAFPDRRKLIADDLPDRTYLPLFIRCRQLGDMAKAPIREILGNIPQRAEMPDMKEAFLLLVNNALRNGEAIILIDGLDEISDESTRVAFIHQLRIFLGTYPTVSIIVTSREAGFRIVGRALITHCAHYRIADFDDADIKRLTVAWHKEVVGNRPEVISEAEKLAKAIHETNRVRLLAKNPLLLTTLLLVKRWVGQLPTRRSVLYGKAIEVLLMTWNVEGHEPLDQEEVVPQLAFVAFMMMKKGIQRISSRMLKEMLTLARKQMPEILGYAKLGVNEFIERVELRSSLMMLSGHEIEQGTIYPMYEFRHLTFQEYLAAKAIVDGHYPNRQDSDTLLTMLELHLDDVRWEEVIPLVAVLSGRKVTPLIQQLINLCKAPLPDDLKPSKEPKVHPVDVLGQCILDEIQIPPDLLKEGLEWISRRDRGPSQLIRFLYNGKYGNILHQIVKDAYMISEKDLLSLGSALADVTLEDVGFNGRQDFTSQLVDRLSNFLIDKDLIKKAAGALAIMDISFYFNTRKSLESAISLEQQKLFKTLGDNLIPILYSDDHRLYFAACWALAWIGNTKTWTPEHNPDVLPRLLHIWQDSKVAEVQYVAAWAISTLPIIARTVKPFSEPDTALIDFIKEQSLLDRNKRWNNAKKLASFVIGFYCSKPWTDEELARLVASEFDMPFSFRNNTQTALLNALGEAGKKELEFLKQKESSKKLRIKRKDKRYIVKREHK